MDVRHGEDDSLSCYQDNIERAKDKANTCLEWISLDWAAEATVPDLEESDEWSFKQGAVMGAERLPQIMESFNPEVDFIPSCEFIVFEGEEAVSDWLGEGEFDSVACEVGGEFEGVFAGFWNRDIF